MPERNADGGSETVKCVLRMPFNPPTLPLPIVSITIGDSKPMWFLVDTGSNAAMTLSRWAAQELQLDKLANVTRTDKIIDGKTFDDYRFAPTLFCVVGAVSRSSNLGINLLNIDCARDDSEIIDRDFRTPHLAGIVGINFWSGFTTQFDFARQTLTVFVDHPDPGSGAAVVEGSGLPAIDHGTVALAMRPWRDFEPIQQVRVSNPRTVSDFGLTNDGAPAVPLPSDQWLVVDTGSDSTALPDSVRPPGSALVGHGPAVKSTVHQHSQSVTVEAGRIASLSLDGQLTEPDVDINWFHGPLTAILGMNFLRRFLVTIDTKHGKLYLQRSSEYEESSRKPGFPGLGLRENSRGVYVVARVADDALTHSGVVTGDEIAEIDGFDLRLYSRYQVSGLVNGFAGTASCLMVRHKDSPVATAVWIARTDKQLIASGSGVSIRLTRSGLCQITGADGTATQLPFRCNPETAPAGDAAEGSFYQRVQSANGAFTWVIMSVKKD